LSGTQETPAAVLETRYRDNPALFEAASPIYRVHHNAPPFFVLSGRAMRCFLAYRRGVFCAALHQVGAATVAHAELPNASRAFDPLATVRCQLVAQAVADFLGVVYGRHLEAAACDRYIVNLCG
jgi:hypothetical protein